MQALPQRRLRNDSGEILRRAEAGERFVITVNGRPVATLGPYQLRRWVPREEVRALLRTPTDPTVIADLLEHEPASVRDS